MNQKFKDMKEKILREEESLFEAGSRMVTIISIILNTKDYCENKFVGISKKQPKLLQKGCRIQ